MCAIFGVGFLNGCLLTDNRIIGKLITNLFKNCQAGGFDASGMAITSAKKINIIKRDVKAKKFVETNAFHTAVREHCNASNVNGLGPVSVLGHCRAATDGAPSVYENNHPIRSGGIVGTHNGIISNTNALFSYWINKYPDIKRHGTVDSEIIFALLDMYANRQNNNMRTAIARTIHELGGTFACSFVNAKRP